MAEASKSASSAFVNFASGSARKRIYGVLVDCFVIGFGGDGFGKRE